MVASVGSMKNALRNSTSRSVEWTKDTAREFVTGERVWKPKKKEISNSRVNRNAMRVYIETAAKNNDPSEEKEVNVPHKPRRVEAFKKKAPIPIKKVKKVQTAKSFSNSKFQKNFDLGVAEMHDYDRSHKGSNIYESTKKLKKDYVGTLRHLEYQLKIYKLLLKFKISRLPKYFRPYAKLHFKRAAKNELPDSVRNFPRHMFHCFHRLGAQQWYINRYRKVLTSLLQNLEFHMETLKTEHSRYESASDNIYEFLYDDSDDYIKQEKIYKNEKNKKTPKNYANSPYIIYDYPDDTIQVLWSDTMFLSGRHVEEFDVIDIGPQPDHDMPELVNQSECNRLIDRADNTEHSVDSENLPPLLPQDDDESSAGFDSEGAFSDSDDETDDVLLESAFGAQVTFIDDNNNVVTIGEEMSDHHETTIAPYDLSRIELPNIATKHSHSETSEDETSSGPLEQPIPELIHGDVKKSAAIDLPPKIPINSNNVANEDILQWLEKQNPQLADSFANEFRISTTQPTRLFPKAKVIAQGPTPTPEPVTTNATTTTMTINSLIDKLTKQYQELN